MPKSRGKVEFNYLGSLFPMEEYNQKDETNQILKQRVEIKAQDASSFGPWIKSRSLNKPKR